MTTTADKIKVMQAFESGAEIQWKQKHFATWIDMSKEIGDELGWDWEVFDYRIKPPDPEPRECWAEFSSVFNIGLMGAWNKDESPSSNAVLMREVTSQMKQNELDGERYRRYKVLAKAQARDWYLRPDKWDEEIDKTMEET